MVARPKGRIVEFSVRAANEHGYPALGELFGELDALHSEALPGVFRRPQEPARTVEFISSRLASDRSALFVAEVQGLEDRIIGCVQVEIREAPAGPIFVPGRSGWIDDLVVRQGWRKRGVGRALLERAHDWLQDRGVEEARLAVWEFNDAARASYSALGYSTASRMLWGHLAPRS